MCNLEIICPKNEMNMIRYQTQTRLSLRPCRLISILGRNAEDVVDAVSWVPTRPVPGRGRGTAKGKATLGLV